MGRIIGSGTFGRVHKAVHVASGRTYALKVISKAACIKEQQVSVCGGGGCCVRRTRVWGRSSAANLLTCLPACLPTTCLPTMQVQQSV